RLIAYCGNDCGECRVRSATLRGDRAALEAVAKAWSKAVGRPLDPEEARCWGCRVDGVLLSHCEIWRCAGEKGLESCAFCPDGPCADLRGVLERHPEREERLGRLRREADGGRPAAPGSV
ncbi:MAG TPA: hypothetical protein DHW14_08960, partial [Clostridiales bacterium]|nr:hypothetical protein [Clostridiales bacterium]